MSAMDLSITQKATLREVHSTFMVWAEVPPQYMHLFHLGLLVVDTVKPRGFTVRLTFLGREAIGK